MIVNYFKFIDDQNVMRCACVIHGQPFYCSSGTSSGLNGAWLPFKKFGPQIPFVSGLIYKLDVAYGIEGANIREYFPSPVANALELWHDEDPNHNNWGRFGNMQCLLISCLLSKEGTIPANIRRAVIDYVGPNNYKNSCLWARPILFDCGYMLKTRKVDEDTIEECNTKLIHLGAVILSEPPLGQQINNVELNQPQSIAPLYPDVHELTGELQQFIDSIPCLIISAMRFRRRHINSESPASQLNNNNNVSDNPLHRQNTQKF